MKTIVLTFDDAVRSQLTIVAPVLKRFGFGATFFVCRFSDKWRAQHSEHLMGLEELRELQRQGFEIGNHTWSHPNMRELSDAENAREVDSLSEWLKSGGITEAPVFAYPGGPYADNAAPLLRQRGFLAARSTENDAWDIAHCDPMHVPATPVRVTTMKPSSRQSITLTGFTLQSSSSTAFRTSFTPGFIPRRNASPNG